MRDGLEGVVTLPRRVRPQPSPFLNRLGDCGACVLGGLLDLDVPAVYARYGPEAKGGAAHAVGSLSWWTMRQALYDAEHGGLLDRIRVDVPMWPWSSGEAVCDKGLPAFSQGMAWFAHLRMALDAGYYGIALVQHARQGGPTDHWVLLCGARDRWVDGSGHQELLVSNSAGPGSEEWVDRSDFLKLWGGFNLLFARPAA
jgi:hypothetical protein